MAIEVIYGRFFDLVIQWLLNYLPGNWMRRSIDGVCKSTPYLFGRAGSPAESTGGT
jgi:hypothetical protein